MSEKYIDENARAAKVIARDRARQEKRKNGLPLVLIVSGWLLKMLSESEYALFQSDVETIKDSFALYCGENDNALNIMGIIYSHRVAKIMIEYVVKYNPGIFDKMIKNPETVTDPETQSNIIAGHLKEHPSDAQKVIENFKRGDIDPRVYNRAARYAKRLKAAEKCK